MEDDVPIQTKQNGENPRMVKLVHEDTLTPNNAENNQILNVNNATGTLDTLINFSTNEHDNFKLNTKTGTLTTLENLINFSTNEHDNFKLNTKTGLS